MKTSAIVSIVIAILVILAGWYAYATYYPSTPAAPSTNTTINTNGNGPDYYPNGNPASSTTSTTASSSNSNAGLGADVNAGVTTGKTVKVTLTATGFSPKSITIKKGDTVTWTNTGSGQMWIASANHPTHTVYDGTNLQQHCGTPSAESPFDECKAGNTYSFTFDKVGSWNYHNHTNASQFGTVVVTQ
jgi:plastocyanin